MLSFKCLHEVTVHACSWCVAPVGFLFVVSSYVDRIELDGTDRLRLASGSTPYTVDFDYRCQLLWRNWHTWPLSLTQLSLFLSHSLISLSLSLTHSSLSLSLSLTHLSLTHSSLSHSLSSLSLSISLSPLSHPHSLFFSRSLLLTNKIKILKAACSCLSANVFRIDKSLPCLNALFEYRNNYLFWSDYSADRIWRSNLDGSNPETLITTGVPCIGMY